MLSSIKKYIKAALYDPITGLLASVKSNLNTSSNELLVLMENHVCTDNTTTTPLGAGATFTGAWQNHLEYQEVNVSVDTDRDSATDGLVIQWSADGVTIADSDPFSVYADSGTNYTPNPAFQFVRVIFTNGVTHQTRFNLMTILRNWMTGGSFLRIDSTLKDDSDGRLTLSVPKLRTAANTYVSGSATNSGNYKISLEELESGVSSNSNSQLNVTQYSSDGNEGMQLQDEAGSAYGIKQVGNKPRVSSMDYLYDIAEGSIPDHMSLNKFGHNNTVGTSWETIWTGSNLYPYMSVADQLEVVSDDVDDSGVVIASTGAWTVILSGLDGNWDEISETVTMNGTTAVTTIASFRRIFRAKVVTAGTSESNEGTITITDQDTGVTRAEITPMLGQTLMATWTVPDGYTFYGTSWYAGSAVTKAIDIGIFVRDNTIVGAAWNIKKFMSFSDTTFKLNEELPVKITSRSDVEIRAKATVGGAEISSGFNGWYEI